MRDRPRRGLYDPQQRFKLSCILVRTGEKSYVIDGGADEVIRLPKSQCELKRTWPSGRAEIDAPAWLLEQKDLI